MYHRQSHQHDNESFNLQQYCRPCLCTDSANYDLCYIKQQYLAHVHLDLYLYNLQSSPR